MSEHASRVANAVDFNTRRWVRIITLLSMDVVAPFYEMMGLHVPDSRALVQLLRSLLLESRRRHDVDPSAVPYTTVEQVLDAITATLGTGVRDVLVWWGRSVFDDSTQDHDELDGWSITLRHCRHDPALWAEFGLPEGLSRDILREFVRSIDTTGYEAMEREVYGKPLSDWDLHLYALNHYDDDDEGAPNGPSTYVGPTVKTYQGYRFWKWALGHLSPGEQTALQRAANLIVRRTESLAFLGELVHPSRLDILP